MEVSGFKRSMLLLLLRPIEMLEPTVKPSPVEQFHHERAGVQDDEHPICLVLVGWKSAFKG